MSSYLHYSGKTPNVSEEYGWNEEPLNVQGEIL